MGYQVPHQRMKPRYNPLPNAAEARHEARLREEPCYGCGANSQCLHHTRLEFPEKRFRRDHRYQLPLCIVCHLAAHEVREPDWLASIGKTEGETIAWLVHSWEASELEERYRG